MKAQTGLAPITSLTLVKTSEPLSQLDRTIREIHEQISRRAYDFFERRGYAHGSHFNDWLDAESELFNAVPVSIMEQDDGIVLHAEVPGFNPQELEVKVEPERVLIQGKSDRESRQQREGKVIYSESQTSGIFRVVDLPVEVDPERASAQLKDGILQLYLPKAEGAKAKQLEVKAVAA